MSTLKVPILHFWHHCLNPWHFYGQHKEPQAAAAALVSQQNVGGGGGGNGGGGGGSSHLALSPVVSEAHFLVVPGPVGPSQRRRRGELRTFSCVQSCQITWPNKC